MADFYSGTDTYGWRLHLVVNQTSTNASAKTCVLSWTLYLECTKSGINSYNSTGDNFQCVIDGTTVLNKSVSWNSTNKITAGSGTKTVNYNSDGTKNVAVSAKYTSSSSATYYPRSASLSGTFTCSKITVGTVRNWSWASGNAPVFVPGKSYKINIDTSTNCRAIPWLAIDNGTYVGSGTSVDSPSPNTVDGYNWMPLKINDGSTGVIPPGTSSFTIRIPDALADKLTSASGYASRLSIDTYTGSFSTVASRSGNIGNSRKTFTIYSGPGIAYNDNGTWRYAKNVWYNDNGTWRKAKRLWYNDNSTWRQAK